MFRLTTRNPDTRRLVRGEHRLLVTRTSRPWLWLVLLLLYVIGALVYFRVAEDVGQEQRRAVLIAENQALRVALAQADLKNREAEATQEQLLGRITKLSAQIERLQTDLAFFRQQKKTR